MPSAGIPSGGGEKLSSPGFPSGGLGILPLSSIPSGGSGILPSPGNPSEGSSGKVPSLVGITLPKVLMTAVILRLVDPLLAFPQEYPADATANQTDMCKGDGVVFSLSGTV